MGHPFDLILKIYRNTYLPRVGMLQTPVYTNNIVENRYPDIVSIHCSTSQRRKKTELWQCVRQWRTEWCERETDRKDTTRFTLFSSCNKSLPRPLFISALAFFKRSCWGSTPNVRSSLILIDKSMSSPEISCQQSKVNNQMVSSTYWIIHTGKVGHTYRSVCMSSKIFRIYQQTGCITTCILVQCCRY